MKRISIRMFSARRLCNAHLAMALGLSATTSTYATVSTTGDVTPDPTTTTLSDSLFIRGTMTVDDSSDVLSLKGFIGRQSNDISIATITGLGSTWTNNGDITLGYGGADATLNIFDGGLVTGNSGFVNLQDQVLVTGAHARWELSDSLLLTGGSVNIGQGATVSTGTYTEIGRSPFGSSVLNAIQRTSTVTIDGSGARLSVNSHLDVGSYISAYGDVDEGILSIANGGQAIVTEDTWVGRLNDTGTIGFSNGTLTTNGLYASATSLLGTGTINTNGLVSDLDLLFNQTQGPQQQVILNATPVQNITFNLDIDGTAALGTGFYGDGSIEIRDGVVVQATEGFLAYHEGSSATATIDGAGSVWNLSSDLRIGRDGDAAMTVSDGGAIVAGGRITVADLKYATASLTVTGDGSSVQANELVVGQVGKGELHILDGASVNVDTDMVLAMNRDDLTPSLAGEGELYVDGSGSQLTVGGKLSTGRGPIKRIEVTNGGLIHADSADAIGWITIDGSGSEMRIDNELAVDVVGVSNGGKVNSGSFDGSTRVDGGGSALNVTGGARLVGNGTFITGGASLTADTIRLSQGLFRVADEGSVVDVAGDFTLSLGSVQILHGGRFENANAIIDGPRAATSGVTIRGGSWRIDGDLRIAETGRATVAQLLGQVDILSGDLILSQFPDPVANASYSTKFVEPDPGYGIYNMQGGLLDLHGNDILIGGGDSNFIFAGGELRNVGTFAGTLVQQGGTLSPGNSPGTMTIIGDYSLNAGSIAIELGGSTPGTQHDQVDVTGQANLGSILELSLIDGYNPAGYETHTVLTSGSRVGTFDQIAGVNIGEGFGLAVTYTDTDVLVTAALLGDANLDGGVDSDDFNLLAFYYNDTDASWGQGDFTGDGIVGSDDFNLLAFNYGMNADIGPAELAQFQAFAASVAVPEPSSLALLGLGGLLAMRRRRRG